MALRARRTINQEGNNTLSTLNLQENNIKSLIDTASRKIAKEEFKEDKTKMCEMTSKIFQNINDRLDEISKKMTELTRSLEFTEEELEGEINNI